MLGKGSEPNVGGKKNEKRILLLLADVHGTCKLHSVRSVPLLTCADAALPRWAVATWVRHQTHVLSVILVLLSGKTSRLQLGLFSHDDD